MKLNELVDLLDKLFLAPDTDILNVAEKLINPLDDPQLKKISGQQSIPLLYEAILDTLLLANTNNMAITPGEWGKIAHYFNLYFSRLLNCNQTDAINFYQKNAININELAPNIQFLLKPIEQAAENKQIDFAPLAITEKNPGQIILLGEVLVTEPEKFAQFLVWQLEYVDEDYVLTSGILHQFIKTYIPELSKAPNPVEEFYQQLVKDNPNKPRISNLVQKARASCCPQAPRYLLSGEEVNYKLQVQEAKPLEFSYTESLENLDNLADYFSEYFFLQLLNQRKTPERDELLQNWIKTSPKAQSLIPYVVSSLVHNRQNQTDKLLLRIAALTSDEIVRSLMAQHSSMLHLLLYKIKLVDQLTQDQIQLLFTNLAEINDVFERISQMVALYRALTRYKPLFTLSITQPLLDQLFQNPELVCSDDHLIHFLKNNKLLMEEIQRNQLLDFISFFNLSLSNINYLDFSYDTWKQIEQTWRQLLPEAELYRRLNLYSKYPLNTERLKAYVMYYALTSPVQVNLYRLLLRLTPHSNDIDRRQLLTELIQHSFRTPAQQTALILLELHYCTFTLDEAFFLLLNAIEDKDSAFAWFFLKNYKFSDIQFKKIWREVIKSENLPLIRELCESPDCNQPSIELLDMALDYALNKGLPKFVDYYFEYRIKTTTGNYVPNPVAALKKMVAYDKRHENYLKIITKLCNLLDRTPENKKLLADTLIEAVRSNHKGLVKILCEINTSNRLEPSDILAAIQLAVSPDERINIIPSYPSYPRTITSTYGYAIFTHLTSLTGRLAPSTEELNQIFFDAIKHAINLRKSHWYIFLCKKLDNKQLQQILETLLIDAITSRHPHNISLCKWVLEQKSHYPSHSTLSNILPVAARLGQIDIVRVLCTDGVCYPKADVLDKALAIAVAAKNKELVQLFFTFMKPCQPSIEAMTTTLDRISADRDMADLCGLMLAIRASNQPAQIEDFAKLIEKHYSKKKNKDGSLPLAEKFRQGQLSAQDTFTELLNYLDRKFNHYSFLRSNKGHFKILAADLLLEKYNPIRCLLKITGTDTDTIEKDLMGRCRHNKCSQQAESGVLGFTGHSRSA
ncbi:hypothetical protein ACFORL_00970 [Legionella dresdenensis]|uniref:Ankyrin repeats (3 copies) n=1 Tax=Legionella dresdenensis TaxID=450200 RepID=A0ABV8CBK9_9GAMM